MKILKFALLLSWSIGSNAKLMTDTIAQTLQVPNNIAARLIERMETIHQLNNRFALYYPILTNVFLKPRGYKIGCEVGVFTGGHAEFILANSNIEKLYCVDPYMVMDALSNITEGFEEKYWNAAWETLYQYAADKLSAFGNRAELFRLTGAEAAAKIADHSLDFVFIDGDHSYLGVITDCTNYYDKVRSGGIISGDDYDLEQAGRAIRDFFGAKKLAINVYQGQTRFWWVEKP